MALLEVQGLRSVSGALPPSMARISPSSKAALPADRPNGAGKTTLFNAVSGALRRTRVTVWFAGADVTALVRNRRRERSRLMLRTASNSRSR